MSISEVMFAKCWAIIQVFHDLTRPIHAIWKLLTAIYDIKEQIEIVPVGIRCRFLWPWGEDKILLDFLKGGYANAEEMHWVDPLFHAG